MKRSRYYVYRFKYVDDKVMSAHWFRRSKKFCSYRGIDNAGWQKLADNYGSITSFFR